jgi:hypothetical protein
MSDKKGKGRPPHEPTQETKDTARRLSALGVPYEDIALRLKISSDTLVKYYQDELDEGRIDANSAIAGTLFNQAKKGNTAAAIFWLKTRAGWKETQVNEHAGDVKYEISWQKS